MFHLRCTGINANQILKNKKSIQNQNFESNNNTNPAIIFINKEHLRLESVFRNYFERKVEIALILPNCGLVVLHAERPWTSLRRQLTALCQGSSGPGSEEAAERCSSVKNIQLTYNQGQKQGNRAMALILETDQEKSGTTKYKGVPN